MVMLGYGKKSFEFDETSVLKCDVILPRDCEALSDPESELVKLIAANKTCAISTLAKGYTKAVVLVPDQTRGTHFSSLIPVLIKELKLAGLKSENISLLICGGTHQKADMAVARTLVGNCSCPLFVHDADDENSVAEIGTTESGTKVRVNRLLLDSFVMGLGIVKHHYYAGYSGGRKIVLPGASGRDSIKANHSLCFVKEENRRHPLATHASLKGNPVHEDMQKASAMVGIDYSVQLVLGPSRKPVAIFAGKPDKAFEDAVLETDRISLFEGDKKYDWVIASCGGFPGDINFLQAHKTIHHAFSFVKPKGKILVLAECSQGMGWEDIVEWARIGSKEKIAEKLIRSYELPGQTAMAMMEKAEAAKIYLLSQLPDEVVRLLGITPVETFDSGINQIDMLNGCGVILPQADLTVHR